MATLSIFLYPVTCSSTIHNTLCAHGNSDYLNVPQHYIIHTLPILLEILIFFTRLWTHCRWPWVHRHLDCLGSDDFSWIAVAVGVWTRTACSVILPSSSGSHFPCSYFGMPHLYASSSNEAGSVGRRGSFFIVLAE